MCVIFIYVIYSDTLVIIAALLLSKLDFDCC